MSRYDIFVQQQEERLHQAEVCRDLLIEIAPRVFRLGSGSIGGKGRGIAFLHTLIKEGNLSGLLPDLLVNVPVTFILATGIFDEFVEQNELSMFASHHIPDHRAANAFLTSELPEYVEQALLRFLEETTVPLAVRSSSLLEDAAGRPFAGIYRTCMLHNSAIRLEDRMEQLRRAVKLVFASTYFQNAKAYMATLPERMPSDKMAVIVQHVSGRQRGERMYPDMAGTARSYNFYPMEGMQAEDGVASVVMGFGKTVVDGGKCVRFSPPHPQKIYQFSSPEDTVVTAQREFLALQSGADRLFPTLENDSPEMMSFSLDAAREDGLLPMLGSVYSKENSAIYDGTSRPGIPLVTLAGVLKSDVFPLAPALRAVLDAGREAFSSDVEIEFAANIAPSRKERHSLDLLQIRPMSVDMGNESIDLATVNEQDAVCISRKALGSGAITGIRDILYVRPSSLKRSDTQAAAAEIGILSQKLRAQERPTLIIGPGRWGTQDRFLGIPVSWHQIGGVRCLVETDFEDIHVDPSQGTHFFQNITSLGIGYFSVSLKDKDGFLDAAWLLETPAEEGEYIRHLSFMAPLTVIVDGRQHIGVIFKPQY
jgi:hypothetical protein